LNVDRQSTDRLSPWLVTFLLVLVAVLPSANSLGAFFVGDDFDFLVRMQARDSASDTLRMTYWGEWEPLWYLGFYRDWKLWGLSPAGYHAANLFWLALGVVALFRLVQQLWPAARLAPWAAALLFATHPLHDEAVTYLAARGHPMSTALVLVTLYSYAAGRREGISLRGRIAWSSAALTAALLGALAKETALVIPVWIAILEWCVLGGMQPSIVALGRGIRAGLLFLVQPAAYLGLRYAAVGLGSQKLRGPDDGVPELLESCARHLPEYALVGGLPLPFAFVSRDLVAWLRPLGWVVAAAVILPVAATTVCALRKKGRLSRPLGICLLGLAIVVVSLLPVFWADLGLRRRYFYLSSAGAAILAAVWLEWLVARRARLAWGLTFGVALAGALGLVHRNDLYRRSGQVTRNLLEVAREAPLDQPSPRVRGGTTRVAFVTLPRYLAGDEFSGAYLLHQTDTRSAFRLAGVEPSGFSTGLKCHHADDYTADVEFEGTEVLNLKVSFRTRRAYDAARSRDPSDDREGRFVEAVLASADDRARVLEYKVRLAKGFLRSAGSELYMYSDGRFRRLSGPE
jgi:hypothetical protein